MGITMKPAAPKTMKAPETIPVYHSIDEKIAALEKRIASLPKTDELIPGLTLALSWLYTAKMQGRKSV